MQFKFTRWEETYIPDILIPEFKSWLMDNPKADASDVSDWLESNDEINCVEFNDVDETYLALVPADNDNQNTVELYDENGNLIWDNVTQFDQPNF